MKHVVLSADNELKVYLVPDFVEQSFHQLCMDFSRNPKRGIPEPHGGYAFDETSFIDYLNDNVCKDEKCVFVEKIGWDYNPKKRPEKYRKCPHFHF